MNKEQRKELEALIEQIFSKAIPNDIARYMLAEEDYITGNTMIEDVVQNVIETSAWKEEGRYNDDDIRFAIGEELMARLGLPA